MIGNKVKLVIWDLDETLWSGTLAEEGIIPIDSNLRLVPELSKRGIINSICSKNDYRQAKAKLEEFGIWDHFVFPSISFTPKGRAVAQIIEDAALRAENVLFIDDNPANCEEVKFFNPGIMTAPPDVLEQLHEHPNLAGKPDTELTRLKQYKLLQQKTKDRSESALSNVEFLRASDIQITVDYDVEKNFDRVVELINRTNQLNFTKRRLNSAEDIEELRSLVTSSFGYHAGCIHARDKYGDYGLIGFFLMQRRAGIKRLVHFVFSCRTMNMGIEQYVYEMLDSPRIQIAQPVSYGLDSHATIDWIGLGEGGGATSESATNKKLVLLGGCDLLQLASYCSIDRLEFVNSMRNGVRVRYDDPGFVLSNRNNIRNCQDILPSWTYDDALRFDEGVASAELILLSLWPGMNGDYYRVAEGVQVRLVKAQTRKLKSKDPRGFRGKFEKIPLDDAARLQLIISALNAIAEDSRQGTKIFALGCYTKGDLSSEQATRRSAYNAACRAYCEENCESFCYIDTDSIIPAEDLVDNIHFARSGYFKLASFILSHMGAAEAGASERRIASPYLDGLVAS